MKKLKVFRNDVDHVVATSPADADAVVAEHTGDPSEQYEWVEVASNDAIRIVDDRTGKPNERTAAEWIKRNGRGHLCSTEY